MLTRSMMQRFSVGPLVVVALAACGGDTVDPNLSLAGTWNLIGFTDGGAAAVTTGTAAFRSDGTFVITGTVTFPDEPADDIEITGTYEQRDAGVTLTTGGESATWTLDFNENRVVLTQVGPPPANTIVLQRP